MRWTQVGPELQKKPPAMRYYCMFQPQSKLPEFLPQRALLEFVMESEHHAVLMPLHRVTLSLYAWLWISWNYNLERSHSSILPFTVHVNHCWFLLFSLYRLSVVWGQIEICFIRLENWQADQTILMVLELSIFSCVAGSSEDQTGQRGSSLTMLIKHQASGLWPRAQPTWEQRWSRTCTHG